VNSSFFQKGSFLFRQGALDGNLFFIKSGLIKAYYDTLDGKEFIKSFIAEGAFIASMQAIIAGMPNIFSVVTLEDCEVLEVSKQ
jgi:CRP-like cAMP-binding protein